MRSAVLVLPFCSFLGCMILHVAFWRFRKPQNHALALLAVFFLPLIFLPFVSGRLGLSLSLFEWVAVLLLHMSLSFSYIQIYPASQADSPSLRIMMLVSESMPRGLTSEELNQGFDPARLFHDRMDDLAAVGQIKREGEKVLLTRQGRFLILPFIWIRTRIGLPWGKG